MTSKNITKAETQSSALDLLPEDLEQYAGLGTSQSSEDNVVPLISLLQALSPQLKPSSPKFVEGAKVGDIYLPGLDDPIRKEITFQPCFYDRKFVEWVPRSKGGGFVAAHDDYPEDTREVMVEGRKKMVRENGNEVLDTRYHYGHVVMDDGSLRPFAIPLKSSGHQTSRLWHTLMNNKRLPSGNVAPSFAGLYLIKTVNRSKNGDDWSVYDVSNAGWATREQFAQGLALHNAFVKGEKRTASGETDAPF